MPRSRSAASRPPSAGQATARACSAGSASSSRSIAFSAPLRDPVWLANRMRKSGGLRERREQLLGRRQRLADDLVHVEVLVAREPADERHVAALGGERLVALVERTRLVVGDRVVRVALGARELDGERRRLE